MFGWAVFDEEQTAHTLSSGCDDEVAMVTAGKEFCLLKTLSGKVMYSGKGSCLGMKGNTRPNRWLELSLSKGSRVSHIAAGHDGQHVVLVMDDGSVLFAGTARRGEDGDNSKSLFIFYNRFLTAVQNFSFFIPLNDEVSVETLVKKLLRTIVFSLQCA